VRLFVGGLSFSTTSEGLRAAFARFGTVTAATVMTDRETGRSRGFGFVEMATDEEADRAISAMNGAMLDGRTIRVDRAMPRGTAPARPPGPRPAMPRPPGPRPAGPPPSWTPPPPPSGRDRKRRGDEERERRGDRGRRPGKPPGTRRAEDKGRRSDETGYRW